MMRNWREHLRSVGVQLKPDQLAAYEREEALFFEAVKIFGNDEDAGMWCLRPTVALPPFETPAQVAQGSAEGLQQALGLLAALAPTVTPRPPRYPTAKGRSSRRRR